MRNYFFERVGGINLAEEFKLGFRSYSVSSDKFARPFAICLIREDGSFLKFRSFTYNIASRLEVGSLLIEREAELAAPGEVQPLPEEFLRELRFSSLNIFVEDSEVESGIVITGESGEELTICPGEMPFSIHVQSRFFSDGFKPEFNLSDYVRADPKP